MTDDVNGHVNLSVNPDKSIGIQFGKVTGDFRCLSSNLESLKGCPYYVGRVFWCGNKLKSLQYCPQYVGSDFICSGNPLITSSFEYRYILVMRYGDIHTGNQKIDEILERGQREPAFRMQAMKLLDDRKK